MKAYKRLLSGVLTVVLLLSGCGATVTAGLFKSKIGFIGETGKNNMKLYDEFKDWERQVSAPVAVVVGNMSALFPSKCLAALIPATMPDAADST